MRSAPRSTVIWKRAWPAIRKPSHQKAKRKVKSGWEIGAIGKGVRLLLEPTRVCGIAAGYCGAFGTVIRQCAAAAVRQTSSDATAKQGRHIDVPKVLSSPSVYSPALSEVVTTHAFRH